MLKVTLKKLELQHCQQKCKHKQIFSSLTLCDEICIFPNVNAGNGTNVSISITQNHTHAINPIFQSMKIFVNGSYDSLSNAFFYLSTVQTRLTLLEYHPIFLSNYFRAGFSDDGLADFPFLRLDKGDYYKPEIGRFNETFKDMSVHNTWTFSIVETIPPKTGVLSKYNKLTISKIKPTKFRSESFESQFSVIA